MQMIKSAGFAIVIFTLTLAVQTAGAEEAATGTWAKKAPMPFGRSEFQAAAVNGKIYAIGGGRTEMRDGKPFEAFALTDNDEYDPQTDTWRARAPMPVGGNHESIAVLDGKIYVAGGFAGRRHEQPMATFYSYDPATDTWSKLASLSGPRASISLTAVAGKIHAFGGRIMGEDMTIATHDVYDPKTDIWSPAAPLPTSRDHAALSVVDGRVYLFGGRTAGSDSSVTLNQIYDPKTDKWSTAAPMPVALSSSAYGQYRGLLLIAGGECNTVNGVRTTFDVNEAYDPKTNTWRMLTALPTGRHGFAAATVGNAIYFLGGSTECGSGGKIDDNLAFTLP